MDRMFHHGVEGERGAQLVEFALVTSLLFFIVLTTIDLCRYFGTEMVLNFAANEGMGMVQKYPNLNQTLRDLKTTDIDYQNFWESRRRVFARTMKFLNPEKVSPSSDTSSSSRLVRFKHIDRGVLDLSGNAPEFEADMALLRPGEEVQDEFGNTISHSFVPSVGAPHPLRQEVLENDQPYELVIQARIKLYTRFFGEYKIVTGRALGFREQSMPKSLMPIPPEFASALPSVVAPSPTPTPTPRVVPSPSPTVMTCVPDFDYCLNLPDPRLHCPSPNPALRRPSGECGCVPCSSVMAID